VQNKFSPRVSITVSPFRLLNSKNKIKILSPYIVVEQKALSYRRGKKEFEPPL